MPDALPTYELYAIRYATREGRRAENFVGGDPHDGPMRMDYFMWVAVGETRTFVIDSGFTAEMAVKRKRDFLRCPIESLGLLGLSGDAVKDVVLTHLHYDHVGNFAKFPLAQFHLQEPEMHFATGRYMRHPFLNHAFEVEDVVGMVRLNYGGRVTFYRGDDELAPGITLHLAGGHSGGLQFLRINTKRGWVVLASDVMHYFENMDSGRPFTTVFHLGDAVEAFDLVRRQAAGRDHIIPGHDPLVMEMYPPPRPELAGIVVRLDVPPKAIG
jgi:glyoxylase-like metal-dependent hydrolase (beta-lactamase superfamily II)